jgi:hypothetical protein
MILSRLSLVPATPRHIPDFGPDFGRFGRGINGIFRLPRAPELVIHR